MRPYRGSWRTYEILKGILEDLQDILGGPTGDPIGTLGGPTRPQRGSWRTYGALKGLLEDLRGPKRPLGGLIGP